MSQLPSQQLVYLDAQGRGTTTCPQCAKNSQVSALAYRDLHAPLEGKCSCGNRFLLLFNTRRFYRKAVHLPGTYTPSGGKAKRRMVVVNLSMTGVHFYTVLPHILQVDDVVELIFHLDNPKHNEMHQKSIIQWVDDKHVGVAFCDLQAYERELGFYLRPA